MEIYDPSGKKYEGNQEAVLAQFISDIEDEKKRIIKKRILGNGKLVFTVWLGINHSLIDSVLIYETMVFDGVDTLNEIDVLRYGTKEDALSGHSRMIQKHKYKGKLNK